jgi:hypothetical protein
MCENDRGLTSFCSCHHCFTCHHRRAPFRHFIVLQCALVEKDTPLKAAMAVRTAIRMFSKPLETAWLMAVVRMVLLPSQ